jgi:hypothetical protein
MHAVKVRTHLWMILVATILTGISSVARAVDVPMYGKPIYDPAAKKYFELIWAFNLKWKEADAVARTQQYLGAQGRLAIVDNIEVHEFLLRTFRPNEITWIGLRYWCGAQSLEDSMGKRTTQPEFQAWAPQWRADPYACNGGVLAKDQEYSPVAYTPVDKGFRWTGWGGAKVFNAYFIEFPTGHP